MKDVKPDTPPQKIPLAAVFFCGSIGPLRSHAWVTKAMPMSADHQPDCVIRYARCQKPADAHADHGARQHHFQIPGIPVVPVPPDGDGVLADQDRQDQCRGFERGKVKRGQRRREQTDTGKAALGQPKRQHGRNGESIEEGIGDHSGERHERVIEHRGRAAQSCSRMAGLPIRMLQRARHVPTNSRLAKRPSGGTHCGKDDKP